ESAPAEPPNPPPAIGRQGSQRWSLVTTGSLGRVRDPRAARSQPSANSALSISVDGSVQCLVRVNLDPGSLAAGYYLVTTIVTALMVSQVLIFMPLLQSRA